jgi:hypothetical protein
MTQSKGDDRTILEIKDSGSTKPLTESPTTAESPGIPGNTANKWIGSKLSLKATQEAADSMARRISSLKSGGGDAFKDVTVVGSRKTGWSKKNDRPPLAESDIDLAVRDNPGFKGSKNESKIIKKMLDIANEFEAATGIKVQIHLRSRYSLLEWAEYFGEYFE